MCGNDWGSQKQGWHVLTIKCTCGHGRKTRPYNTMFFVGAGLVPALARNTNGTDGATT
jgi:hypothetical protein